MCIARVSNNLFPFDRAKKPTSIVATTSLVVAVASGILIGVAYSLNWGMTAVGTLSAVSGVAIVVALAIICCIKPNRNRNAIPIPSQLFPQAFSSVENHQSNEMPADRANNDLYTLIRNGDTATFRQAIEMFDAEHLDMHCRRSGSIWLDPNDTTTNLSKGTAQGRQAYSLYDIILHQTDGSKKEEFLRGYLENLEDHVVDEHRESILAEFLKMHEMIDLLYKKLNARTIEKIITIALDPKTNFNQAWVDAFFKHWLKDQDLQTTCRVDWLIKKLLKSHVEKNLKKKYLTIIAKHKKSTLEKLELDYYDVIKYGGLNLLNTNPKKCTLLHMAIAERDIELVKELASCKYLLEKSAVVGKCQLTPLLQAIMNGELEIVQILLAAKANPNVLLLRKGSTSLSRARLDDSTHVTPLMIAARMGRSDIVQVLLNAGADPAVKDGNDARAWTMNEYAEEYRKEEARK